MSCNLFQYEIPFTVSIFQLIKEDLKINLTSEKSSIFFNNLSSPNGFEKSGKLFVCIDSPKDSDATKKGKMILELFFNIMSIENNTQVGESEVESNFFIIKNPILLNQNKIKKKVSFIQTTINGAIHSPILLDKANLQLITKRYNSVQKVSNQYQPKLLKFLRCYSKSHRIKTSNKKIIELWKALEHIIGDPTQPQNLTLKSINCFSDIPKSFYTQDMANDLVIIHNSLIIELSKENLFSSERNRNYSKDLEIELKKPKKNSKTILKCTLKCIYSIRNIAFHQSNDHSLIPKVNSMLNDVLRCFWKVRINQWQE